MVLVDPRKSSDMLLDLEGSGRLIGAISNWKEN